MYLCSKFRRGSFVVNYVNTEDYLNVVLVHRRGVNIICISSYDYDRGYHDNIEREPVSVPFRQCTIRNQVWRTVMYNVRQMYTNTCEVERSDQRTHERKRCAAERMSPDVKHGFIVTRAADRNIIPVFIHTCNVSVLNTWYLKRQT